MTEDSRMPIRREEKHLPWLDWMRFLAALAVVVCHVRGGHWLDWGRMDGADKTWPGAVFFALTRPNLEPVIVFFLLSGFLVGGRLVERLQDGTFRVWDYALDRFTRIYIPLLPALVVSGVIAWYCGVAISWRELAGNIFALQGAFVNSFGKNEPLWSLSYEIWFYVLGGFAAVCVMAKGRGSYWGLVGLLIGFLIFTKLSPLFLLCWMIGALAYPLRTVTIGVSAAAIGFIVTAAAIILSQLNMASASVRIDPAYLPSREVCALLLSAGLAIVISWLCGQMPKRKTLQQFENFGTKLAAFSYTLYLTHYPLMHLWEHFDNERLGTLNAYSFVLFFLKIAYCLLFAWLLYLPFEAQTNGFRRRLKGLFVGKIRA